MPVKRKRSFTLQFEDQGAFIMAFSANKLYVACVRAYQCLLADDYSPEQVKSVIDSLEDAIDSAKGKAKKKETAK